MKKITIVIVLAFLGVMVSSYALAASFEFSPANGMVTAGESVTLNVSLNPEGVKNYTTKMEVTFPADILQVNSFVFAGNWVPLTASGYDLINHTGGVLIKTGGYFGGAQNPVPFGIISFTARKGGSATITLAKESFSLGADGQNLLTTNPLQASLSVKPALPTVTQTTPSAVSLQSNPTSKQNEIMAAEQALANPITNVPATNTSTANQSNPATAFGPASLLGAAKNILSLGSGNSFLAFLLLLIILAGVWYAINYLMKKKSKPDNTSH